MSESLPPVSIVVPAYRESANLKPLTERIFAATRKAAIEAELIIVDDNSQDGTESVVDSLASDYPVRLVVRTDQRGLSSAVLAGFAEARYDRFIVMDADLQHPPEAVPEMLKALENGDCDFVSGTRYTPGGEIAEDWPLHRRLVSLCARLTARPLTPLSDPLSGFFAIHRRTWERAKHLDSIGYKIALEIYVKAGCRRPAEVSIRFNARHAGESKLTGAVIGGYLGHLLKLYRSRFPWLVWTIPAAVLILIALAFYSLGSTLFHE